MGDSSKQLANNSFRLPNRPITVAVQLMARPLGRSLPHVRQGCACATGSLRKPLRAPDITDDATDWRKIGANPGTVERVNFRRCSILLSS
jgi:hypothetical protein